MDYNNYWNKSLNFGIVFATILTIIIYLLFDFFKKTSDIEFFYYILIWFVLLISFIGHSLLINYLIIKKK